MAICKGQGVMKGHEGLLKVLKGYLGLYALLSKLLISPLIRPRMLPYIIPPLRGSDYSCYIEGSQRRSHLQGAFPEVGKEIGWD